MAATPGEEGEPLGFFGRLVERARRLRTGDRDGRSAYRVDAPTGEHRFVDAAGQRLARVGAPVRAFVVRLGAAIRRRNWRWLRIGVFALVGAVLAVVVFGRVNAKVGPFATTIGIRPSLVGTTVVRLSPLGTIELDTHDWPLALDLRVDEIGVADAERIARHPATIDRLAADAPDQVRDALVGLAVRCVLLALAGAVVGALIARLSWRSAALGAALGALLVGAVGLGTFATFRADSVSEPRYTGLLTRAPRAIGDIEAVIDRFGEYREQLSDLVDNVATLYLAGAELPTFEPDSDLIRVLHVSDIHLNVQAFELMERLTDQFGIDVIADTGDITDWGTTPEAQLVERIGDLDVPYVWVRGNHDSRNTQRAVASQPNAVVLDGEPTWVEGLRFWGIGDPRYTPDRSQDMAGSEQEVAEAFGTDVAEGLAADEPPRVDVVMVHDRRMAGELGGQVPLVLAGHTHEPAEDTIAPPATGDGDDGTADTGTGDDEDADTSATTATTDATTSAEGAGQDGTLLLVEGSTGGAGLRGLQGEEPEPLSTSILYFDPDTRQLVAYDRITVAWLDDAGATIDRHIVGEAAEATTR
jgi:predicted phosphodiesterase